MTRKFDINLVKEIVEAEGYKLVSEEYVNSATKIDLICSKGHSWSVTLNNFRSQGQRCPACLDKTLYDLSMVKDLLYKDGYVLVTEEYENMHQKLETLCPKKHTYFTSLTNYIGNGSRCLTCNGIKRYTVEEIRDILKKEGYVLITDHYRNAHQKLEAICPKGHNLTIKMNGFISNEVRCQQCAINRPYPPSFIKEFVAKRGYTLVSENYDPTKKIELICPNGHIYNTSTFYNFKKGRKCPECTNKGSSEMEREILSWVNEFYPNAKKEKIRYDLENGKKYLELDVYIKELGLAIEYNGLIWHCEKYKKDSSFHANKMRLANRLGIRILNIFGDEWRDRKDQIKNHLLSVMGKSTISIGARKTEIRSIDRKEAKSFLDRHHIQGSATIGAAFGLYFENDLVAVMTGNKHHRQGQENSFVLNRLAFKSGVSIQGGSSKLLKALISYAKERGYSRLISWSDNRWSEGRVYEKMGFVLEEEMGPDYSYVKREDRVSKQSCQKKDLLRKGAKGTMANTEQELALSLGLYRIWDCGKKRWVMDLPK